MIKPIKDIAFLRQLLDGEIINPTSSVRFPLLILVENPLGEKIPEAEEYFLNKILNAIQLDIDSVKIINIAYGYNYQSLQEIPSKRVMGFGLMRKLPNFPDNETKYVWQMKGEYEFLFVDSLKLIMENADLKKQLWSSLKQRYSN
jgi:hypothetical protein